MATSLKNQNVQLRPVSDVSGTAKPGEDHVSPLPRILVWIMAAACATAVANIYYNQPLLNDFASYFHTTARSAGLIATAAQVGYGLGLLLFIPLGDILESRKIILCLSYSCTLLLSIGAVVT